ncbi:MAG: UxaA family hydrolase [Alphaproteobacteria bacterium]|jgi:hypothetical protein|nr:UxaA family hydrolase [Alphaproteobacteria bacterium]
MANEKRDDPRLLRLSPKDNIAVLIQSVGKGERLSLDGQDVVMPADIGLGHKLALRPLAPGDTVYKYGAPIGSASKAIAVGEHVHNHNLKSDYIANYSEEDPYEADLGGADIKMEETS